jgi:hypothetical protein
VAGPAGDAQEVYALHPKGRGKYYNLGKLSIASYAPQSHKVVLVSVEGAPVEEGAIREALAQVYGLAAISWQVEKAPGFAYTGNQRLMEQSTGLSTYNAGMRALNEAYRQAMGAQYDPGAFSTCQLPLLPQSHGFSRHQRAGSNRLYASRRTVRLPFHL